MFFTWLIELILGMINYHLFQKLKRIENEEFNHLAIIIIIIFLQVHLAIILTLPSCVGSTPP